MTRRRYLGWFVGVLVAIGVVVTVQPLAAAQTAASSVEITVQPGVGGVVTAAPRVPIRIMLTSDRSRTVRVELTTTLGKQYYEVALNTDAPTPLDVVVQAPVDRIEVEATDADGKAVGRARSDVEVDTDEIVVGVGSSIAGHKDPWQSRTIADIQQATLVPLGRELLDRPGVLDMLTGLVLAPADVEQLSAEQSRRVGAWVAAGGNLALDQARSDPLPVLGSTAESGDRTAVEAGWVRFTGGAAARGAWTDVIEPGTILDSSTNGNPMDMGMGGGFNSNVFDEQLRHTGFLQISYLSSSVIIAAVFVTALLVGPVLWFLLRSRARRRWMWFIAPALSVAIAALLATAGQGALSDATTSAMGSGLSTGWATRGEFGFGTTEDQTDVALGADGQVWASSPRIRVTGSGSDRTARQPIGTNAFGYVGLGLVDVSDSATISVTATAKASGKVTVSVTNHGRGELTGVDVRGFSRTRGFSDVGPGETETLDFEASDDLKVFSPEFPPPADFGIMCTENFCTSPSSGVFGRAGFATYSARGRIEIHGTLTDEVEVGGHPHRTTMQVIARAAVVADENDTNSRPHAVRIESIGPQVLGRNDGAFQPVVGGPDTVVITNPDGSSVFVNGGVPTTIPPPVIVGQPVPTTTIVFDINGNPIGPDGQPIQPSLPVMPATQVYALLSSPTDIDSLRCSIHTVLDQIEVWTDGAWVPVPPAGERANNPSFNEPNETRDYDFGRVGAGETRILRMSAGLAVNPAPAFTCGAGS